MLILAWLFFSFFVAAVFGAARTIGFLSSLFICLILSPLIGIFITMSFKTKEEAAALKKQNSVADEIGKLAELRQSNKITDAEFEQLKQRIIS